MVQFLSKFQSHGIKIDRVNSIRAAKPMIFFNILRAVASLLSEVIISCRFLCDELAFTYAFTAPRISVNVDLCDAIQIHLQ